MSPFPYTFPFVFDLNEAESMPYPMQSRTRLQIRQAVGYNLNSIIVGTASADGTTTSLIDTYGLQLGGDDEYNGGQVQINTAATAGASVGEKGWVTDYATSTKTLTLGPALTAAVKNTQQYEYWRPPYTVEDVNDAITEAMVEMSADALQIKQSVAQFTERDKFEYDCLSSFKGVNEVEYCYVTDIYEDLHNCDTAWDESVDSDVTLTVDTEDYLEGSGCNNLVVAAGASAGDILATDSISSTDISRCDAIEIRLKSSTALTASYMQLLLDNTASCASPLETLNIPATSANVWTTHTISLANPYSDTAIISIGLKMASDVGAFTLKVDYIRAVNTKSRKFKMLNPDQWDINHASTPLLVLTPSGKAVAGDNTCLRITGYELPDLFSDDTTYAEVDPGYLVAAVTYNLLATHAKSYRLDIENRDKLADRWLRVIERRGTRVRTAMKPNTRLV